MPTERFELVDRKELKRAAKGIIAEGQPGPVRVTMLYLLIITGVSIGMNVVLALTASMRGESLFDPLSMFFNILILLFEGVLGFGYTRYSLHLADRADALSSDIFSGFSETGRVILMNLILFGFGLLWYLAIIAAAMVPMMVVSMISGLALSGVGESAIIVGIWVMVGVFVAAILLAFFLVMVRYALSAYVLADDGAISSLNAVRRSRVLLRGRNKEMFLLQLSFLGWNLLSILIYSGLYYVGGKVADATGLWWMTTVFSSLGSLAQIPFLLWLQPYVATTYALYYRHCVPRPETQAVSAPLPEADTPWRAGN